MNLKSYQKQAVEEKTELDAKIEELTAFINSNKSTGLPVVEKARLSIQRAAMLKYTGVLGDRIAYFAAQAAEE